MRSYNDIPDELTEQELDLLASLSSHHHYSDGDIIFRQNSEAVSMYIIGEGRVLVRFEEEEEDRELASLEKGEFLGEMGLLGEQLRNASAYAVGETELWELDQPMFDSLMQHDKLLADKLLKAFDKRKHS